MSDGSRRRLEIVKGGKMWLGMARLERQMCEEGEAHCISAGWRRWPILPLYTNEIISSLLLNASTSSGGISKRLGRYSLIELS